MIAQERILMPTSHTPQAPHTSRNCQVRLDPGSEDISVLIRMIEAGQRVENEDFARDHHLDEIIPKPWGYEYRAYVDDFFDLWALHIETGQTTSMHAHPRKLVQLLCLAGQGVTSGLNGQVPIQPGAVVRINPGAFHATRNTGPGPLDLIEVESPRNKLDLWRLRDDYDREEDGYETEARSAPSLPLQDVAGPEQARYRPHSPDRRFDFDLAGGSCAEPSDSRALMHIPLGVAGLLGTDVLAAPAIGGHEIAPQRCLLVTVRALRPEPGRGSDESGSPSADAAHPGG
jgi:mannose-6-phosphate isomerase-like protein (cupin superfamily)